MSWRAGLVMIAVILVVVFAMLWIVFTLIKRAIIGRVKQLVGIELDSGSVKLVTRFSKFRAAKLLMQGGIKAVPARLVLTKTHLHFIQVPQRYGVFDRGQLDRFTVGIVDGKLHLVSDNPPDASGRIDYRAAVKNPEEWVAALTAAGAQRAA